MKFKKQMEELGFDLKLPLLELPPDFSEVLISTTQPHDSGVDDYAEVLELVKDGPIVSPYAIVAKMEDGRVFAQRRDPCGQQLVAEFVNMAAQFAVHPEVGELNVTLWANRPVGNNITRDAKEVKKAPASKTSKKAKK